MSKDYYNTRDTYKVYKKKSSNPIEVNEYCRILNSFFKFYMSKLFELGEIVIPERLGKLQIYGKKVKVKFDEEGNLRGLAPDWKSTKELWERDEEAKENKQIVYHFNEDTGGVRYKVYWNKTRVLFSNKTLFRLKLSRANKRYLSSIIKEGKEYLIK